MSYLNRYICVDCVDLLKFSRPAKKATSPTKCPICRSTKLTFIWK